MIMQRGGSVQENMVLMMITSHDDYIIVKMKEQEEFTYMIIEDNLSINRLPKR